VDGPYFLAHLLGPRRYSPSSGWEKISEYAVFFQLPLAIVLTWILSGNRVGAATLLVWTALVAHFIACAFSGGYGVDRNIFFDSVITLALITGVALWSFAPALAKLRFSNGLLAVALFLPLFGVFAILPTQLWTNLHQQRALPQAEAEFRSATEFLKARPGPALCESLLLCYDAGKPLLYDPYFVSSQLLIGRIQEASVLALLDGRRFPTVEIELPAGEPLEPRGRPLWFDTPFMRTLVQNYSPALRTDRFLILAAKEGLP
jgi:hypothetical protein